MILKPQDVLVLLKLVSIYPHEWAYNTLAVDLGMSPSEVHAAVKRSVKAGLANHGESQIKPNISRLEEFLVYGIQYVFVPDRGELTRGMPTAFAASLSFGKLIRVLPAPYFLATKLDAFNRMEKGQFCFKEISS